MKMVIYFEANSRDNQEDELLKLVDQAIINAEEECSATVSPSNALVEGESVETIEVQFSEEVSISYENKIYDTHVQGEFN